MHWEKQQEIRMLEYQAGTSTPRTGVMRLESQIHGQCDGLFFQCGEHL